MNPASHDSARDRQLEEILHAYLQAVDAGRAPERDALLRQHPDFAAELAAFFANQDEVAQLARGMTEPAAPALPAAEAPTVAPGEAPVPAPGTQVRYFGDYELLEELARGGMGVVYHARQVTVNRPVALKMILAGQFASADDVQRFHTEAETAANLDHPHIVPIYEVGEHEGQHYFSMKLIEGGSLIRHLPSFVGDPRAAARLLATAARAVHHAHQRGLLHRDLKPGNILLDKELQPYVTDFGLARRVEGSGGITQSGAIVGTPEYMAPEQAEAKKVLTTAVDVYALGAILYALLTGRPPFQSGNVLDTLVQVVLQEPVPPRSLNAQAPRDLEVICLKCLNKDPLRRYGSAELLAEELERWLDGEPILARPAGTVERIVKWAKRRPAAAALLTVSATAALALVAIVAVSAVLVYGKNQDLEQANNDLTDQRNQARAAEGRANDEKAVADEQRRRAKDELDHARRNRFTAQLARVAAIVDRDPGQARTLLDDTNACPLDLRDFAWGSYYRLARPDRLSRPGLAGGVSCAAFTADGKWLATATNSNNDGVVRLWDVTAGQQRAAWKTADPVASLAFTRDGTILAAATARAGNDVDPPSPGQVVLWDVAAGKEKAVLRGHPNKVRSLAFSPDGRLLASASGGTTDVGGEVLPVLVKLWDVEAGKERASLEGPQGEVMALAFSPDGKSLAAGGWELGKDREALPPGMLLLWDIATGKAHRSLHGHSDQVAALAFVGDGGTLASASRNRELKLWDVAAGRERVTFFLRGSAKRREEAPDFTFASSAAFSADGRHLAGGIRILAERAGNGLSDIVLWDVMTGQEQVAFKGTAKRTTLTFRADGRELSAVAADGTVTVWDLAQESSRSPFPGETPPLSAAAISADGKLLATGGAEGERPGGGGGKAIVQIWDVPTRTLRATFRPPDEAVVSLALTPDGRTLAVGGHNGSLTVWDVLGGKQRIALEKQALPVRALTFSADGQLLASGSADWEGEEEKKAKTDVKVWDVSTGTLRAALKGHGGAVRSMAFTTDGKRLAVAGGSWGLWGIPKGGEVIVWDVATAQECLSLKALQAPVNAVAFAPDGKTFATGSVHVFAAGRQGDLRLWDAATGREIAAFVGHARGIRSLAFTPDGKTLASGGAWSDDPFQTEPEPQELKLWDVATGQERASLAGHSYEVFYLAFTADGKTLASASGELVATSRRFPGAVRLWDVCSPTERATLQGHPGPVQSLSFTAEGKTLAAGSVMETKLWDVVTGEERRTLRHGQFVARPTLTPDGKTLVAGSSEHDDQGRPLPGQLIVWDAATGKERLRVTANSGAISALALSPDGKTVAAGGMGWDKELNSHLVPGNVKVYDVDTGKERFTCAGIDDFDGNPLAFSADGRLLTVGRGMIDVWDVTTREKRASLTGHRGHVRGVAFSPDGALLVSVSGWGKENKADSGGEIKLWDLASGKERAVFDRQTQPVNAVAFALDGKTFVTGGDDGTVRFWDVATGKERAVYREHAGPVLALAFSADGKTLASGSSDQTVKLWDVPR